MQKDDLTPEFVVKVPFMTELINEIKGLRMDMEVIKAKMNPKQEFYTLMEACALKGISYGTLSNKSYAHLKPNGGKPDAIISNRERWTWENVQKWLRQSDEELISLYKGRK